MEIVIKQGIPNYDETPQSGVFNYSNMGMTNWADFAREIFQQSNIKCDVSDTTTRAYNAPAPRPLWSMMSKEKIQRVYRLKIPHWTKSLKQCLRELSSK